MKLGQLFKRAHKPPEDHQTPDDDQRLVRAARGGDREAYRRLVERYQRKVYSIAFEILRNREDAEDVAQEAFVKAYLSLQEFKGDSSFFTWLYRITYNMALDVRRRLLRRGGATQEFREGALKEPEELAPILGKIAGPHEALLTQERLRLLQMALDSISEEHRTVVVLREVDGLSYEEIARITGINLGTVMSRLHYARKKLQEALSSSEHAG